jgi:hypothetical protein
VINVHGLAVDTGVAMTSGTIPFPTCDGASSSAALGPDGVQDRRRVEARAATGPPIRRGSSCTSPVDRTPAAAHPSPADVTRWGTRSELC